MTVGETEDMILLVEDNDDDAFLTERAFKRAGLANPLRRFVTAEEAIDYLNELAREVAAGRTHLPAMMLLDLNLPCADGDAVLAEVRANPALQKLPVIVLTTSRDPVDIDRCYRLGANSYIQKPVDFEGMVEAVQRMQDYWFKVVVLPRD